MVTSSNGTFSVLLTLCEGNPLVTGGFPSQRPVTQSFDVFFDQNNRDTGELRRIWTHYDVTFYDMYLDTNFHFFRGAMVWIMTGCWAGLKKPLFELIRTVTHNCFSWIMFWILCNRSLFNSSKMSLCVSSELIIDEIVGQWGPSAMLTISSGQLWNDRFWPRGWVQMGL